MGNHAPNIAGQFPISLSGGGKTDLRTQFAALCFRKKKKGKIEFLLVTSRASKRWIVPKGWPIDGKTPAETALVEAWEEAGVKGASDGRCVGIFSYAKGKDDTGSLPCLVMVFTVEVTDLAKVYPESGERKRLWVSRKKAARLVEEPELSRIIRDFVPGDGN